MKSKKLVKTAVIVGILVILAAVLSFVVFSGSAGEVMKVYFFPMNMNVNGDCCIITIGDKEILIDAGANVGTGKIVAEKMKEYISEDGVWDYVIATHPDYDHIAGFLDKGVWDFFKSGEYTLDTLIDFDTTMDPSVALDEEGMAHYKELFSKQNEKGQEPEYDVYSRERDFLKEKGKIKNYYTASQCCWKARGSSQPENGAKNVFKLGNNATLNILYNYYYDHNTEEKNMMSVCTLIKCGDKSFLFTGDLEEEKYGGETELINNPDNKKLFPKSNITVYKAGHHGSKTSSSQNFINYIRPEYVVISACAGGQYNFPSADVAERLFSYTDKIYITSARSNDNTEYYGDIIFITDGKTIEVKSSGQCDGYIRDEDDEAGTEDDTVSNEIKPEYKWESLFAEEQKRLRELYKQINKEEKKIYLGTPRLIQDTWWYKANRNDVFNVYTLYGDNNGESNCTLIKYGHTELLIDCGMNRKGSQQPLIDKVKKYCNDGVIEYAVVTTSQSESIGGLVGDSDEKGNSLGNGLLDIFEFGTIIEFSASNFNLENPKQDSATALAQYLEKRQKAKVIPASEAVKENDGVTLINGSEYFTLDILESKFYRNGLVKRKEDDYSVCCLVTFRGKKLLFLGDLTDSSKGMQYLLEKNEKEIANVDFYRAPNYGGAESYTEKKDLGKKFLNHIKPKFVVVDCMAGMLLSQKGVSYPGVEHVKALVDNEVSGGNVYLTGQLIDGQNTEVCGDITYTLKSCNGKVEDPIISEGEIKITETQWWQDNAA